jgi:hypothetical protein
MLTAKSLSFYDFRYMDDRSLFLHTFWRLPSWRRQPMSDRSFSHPIPQVQWGGGREVILTFVCDDRLKAAKLAHELLRQVKTGALNMTLKGDSHKARKGRKFLLPAAAE